MTYIVDLQYFGNVNYYYELINSMYCEFDSYEPYQKMSFKNRCSILGANGPIDLSIPVVGGREVKCRMDEVKVCYKEDWRSRHFKTLVSCYNRSPWFHQYSSFFEDLYSNKTQYLYEWDLLCGKLLEKVLLKGIKINSNTNDIFRSSDTKSVDTVIDLRGRFLPKNPNPFGLIWKPYPQVFADRFGFVPHLSILDLLFCEGPRAIEVLKSSAKKP